MFEPLASLRRALTSRPPRQDGIRVLVKTVLYRMLMVGITVVVAFVLTGSVGDALSIGVATNAIKAGVYYGYERTWGRITWGVPPEGIR